MNQIIAAASDRVGPLIALTLIVALWAGCALVARHRAAQADTEAHRRAVLRDLAHRRHHARHGRSRS